MEIAVVHRYRGKKLETRALSRLLRWLSRRMERPEHGCTLLLCGDREIEDLNRRFLGRARPTDVLAFPGGEGVGEPDYLGDIAVSVETAGRQAARRGQPLLEEIYRLTVHGYLHLLGYDHEIDRGEMRRIEESLLRECAAGSGIPPTVRNKVR